MKHLFWGIALLLAAAATAQPQTANRPVMRMGDPDLYLELKPRTAPPAKPALAEQPTQPDKPGTAERGPLAEYLLHLTAWEACCPDKFTEEMQYLYTYMFKGETPLPAEQLEYLARTQRLREYASEK